jgi:hypothetical protein
VKVSGQGVLVIPDVVMNDVVEVVSGQGLWYVDFSSVIHDDVSAKAVSKVKCQGFAAAGLPVQGVT